MDASLGIIETRGLIASIEAADVMLKFANVKLLQRSQPGAGLTLIICIGDLGDCQAAVDAGAAAVARIGELYSKNIIARPGEGLAQWLRQTGYACPLNINHGKI